MPLSLSPDEYREAIYIDFEGEGRSRAKELREPHMVGEFKPNQKGKGGKYNATYFRENWDPVKNGAYSASSVLEFSEYFDDLALRLELEDSFLVFWSIHEETVMHQFLPDALFKRLKPRLHNLHPVGKRYANRRKVFGQGSRSRGRSLEEFFEALYRKRYPMPPITPGPAEVCRRLDTACGQHYSWRSFSDVQKKYARDLVAYNKGDCQSTWLIAKKVGNFYAS
jgi:hypothetical protein